MSRHRWLVPVVLLLIYFAQCVWFLRTQSLTYDEPVHIAEGLEAWRHGRFEQYNDHPPLARLLCTLPLIGSKWRVDLQQQDEGFHVLNIAPDPESLAWRARLMNVLLGVVLAGLVWSAADRLFSLNAANFALALFALSPSLIAHFSVVTTDGIATLMIFAIAWQVVHWKSGQSWRQTILFGILLGVLLLAKYSTVVMFALALLWMLILRAGRPNLNPLRWNWGKAAAALLLAVFVVWGGYFFHVSHLTVHDGTLTATFPNWHETLVKPVHSHDYSAWVPAGEFILGFREVARHNRHGQPAFFLGHVSPTGGWKLYYPVTIFLKWPVVVLFLCLGTLAAFALRKLRLPADVLIMLSFPAVYFCCALFARFNLGERHILPLYPFALLLTAALWEYASPRPWGKAMLFLLIAINAVDTLRYAPGYLSYFTPFVHSEASHEFLSDSNLSWGQGLLAVREYEHQHPEEQIWLAYFGSVDPSLYGARAQTLRENVRVTGTIIVSTTSLSGQYLMDPNGYRWVLRHKPVEILDYSLYVYKIAGP